MSLLLQVGEVESAKQPVSRKRSTHGEGALARRKRRVYMGEKRETAPLLSMLPTSKTLTVEEVVQQIKLLIQTLCEVR